MPTYISILRGVNVSGKNLIKMPALKAMYEQLGFDKVTTYVQSGNVIFTGKTAEPNKLEKKIAQQIAKTFACEVPVIVLPLNTLTKVITKNPLAKDEALDPKFLHVTFLATKPKPYELNALEGKLQRGERISVSGQAVYLYCPNGYGTSKLTNNFLESRLGVVATTRNWRTTNELLRLAQELPETM